MIDEDRFPPNGEWYVFIHNYLQGESVLGKWSAMDKLYILDDGDGYTREQLIKGWPGKVFFFTNSTRIDIFKRYFKNKHSKI